MTIEIIEITKAEDLQAAWAIRKEVFVVEQACAEDLEWEHEEESTHFLALLNGVHAGTARYRTTDNGIKLERFAVLKNARNKGIGAALVQRLLRELTNRSEMIYLHAQLTAKGLYAKFGFREKGEHFWEAGIEHVKMVWHSEPKSLKPENLRQG
ncbi:MAG: GNAT family N-acetyltransferase [Bacteroidia bacterium]|nr:GNAT family N-acetyltransferase [Bacteroidia bacterium]